MKKMSYSRREKEYIDIWGKIKVLESDMNKMEHRFIRELTYLKKVIGILEKKIEEEKCSPISQE